jgi:23S rRNA (pseudouridine1915-N3)-methyltransferase
MKVRIVALGRRMPAWVTAGFADYAGRLPREWAFELVELRAEPRGEGRSIAQMLAAEAARIVPACSGYRMIALDEHGTPWTTTKLAGELRRRQADGDDVAFIIGSADGLAADVKRSAHAVVALSAMTLPHGLVRVVLAEQLYRAHSVATGHPYHRQ